MASFGGSPVLSKGDDLCDTICKLMRDSDTTAVPVVDIIQSACSGNDDDEDNLNGANSRLNDDELDDLLEEQLVLGKIKEIQNTRRNLGIKWNRPLSGIDTPFDANNLTTSQDENNGDTDSLLNFSSHASDKEDAEKYKEDVSRLSKALTANVVMQSELNKLESFLLERLKVNHMNQSKVKEEISQLSQTPQKTCNESRSKSWYKKYGIPYFKDEKYFPCSNNLDIKRMKSSGQVLSINFNVSKMWSLNEKELLEEGVRKLLIIENTASLMEEMNKLKQMLRSDSKEKNEINEKLEIIKQKIETVKSKNLNNLFNKCSSDREFDWFSVSHDYVRSHSASECQRMWHLYVKPSINKTRWSPKEDKMLLSLVDKYQKQNWDLLANDLGTCRTGYQCFVNYQTRLNKEMRKCGKWTKEEDEHLASLIAKCRVGGFIPWTKIAYYFQGRSLSQIYCRWNSSLNPDLKKGRFSRREDRMIASFVRQFGENFSKISKLIGDRTSVQLRERYLRAIPAKYRNVGRWSLDEDKLLMTLVKKHGVSNWSSVSSQFVTRSRTQVRQRYAIIQKILTENPNFELEDFHRGPSAQSKSSLPHILCEQNARKDTKRLADLIEEHQNEESLLKKQNSQLTYRIKTGRKRIIKRNEVDTKLINYFRESYTNEHLMLKTHYLKPDIEKALNAMAIFFQFLHVHITLPQTESLQYKKLPSTLRSIVLKMRKLYKVWGCTCLDRDLPSHSYFCRCKNQNSIDCYPVNSSSTLVDESDYILSFTIDNVKPVETVNSICMCSHEVNRHFIPYYLPPNIITSIGFRSALLMKDKIAICLAYNRKKIGGYFSNSDVELRFNDLKHFTGYFSEEGDSSCDEENISKEHSTDSRKTDAVSTSTRNLSNSEIFSTISLSNSEQDYDSCKEEHEHVLYSDVGPPFREEPTLGNQETPKRCRLTPQEAIGLWKERLMTILGWPIVLSNQSPDMSSKVGDSNKCTNASLDEEENVCSEESAPVPEESLLLESDLKNKGNVVLQLSAKNTNVQKKRKRKFCQVGGKSNFDNSRFAENIGSKEEALHEEYSSKRLCVEDGHGTRLAVNSQPIADLKAESFQKHQPQNDNSHSSANVTDDSLNLTRSKVLRCYSRKKTNTVNNS